MVGVSGRYGSWVILLVAPAALRTVRWAVKCDPLAEPWSTTIAAVKTGAESLAETGRIRPTAFEAELFQYGALPE